MTKTIKERCDRIRSELEVVEKDAASEQNFHRLEFWVGFMLGIFACAFLAVTFLGLGRHLA